MPQQRGRRLTDAQALQVVVAILEGADGVPMAEDRIAEVLTLVDVNWTLAHDERAEFDEAPGTVTKAEIRNLLRNLKAKHVRIVPELADDGKVDLVYTNGRRVDIGAGKVRRRPGVMAWMP